MPRKNAGPNTINYTSHTLTLSIIKALMLRGEGEGYTAAELGAVLCTDPDRVKRLLNLMHEEYGLVWISGWKRYKGQQTGSAARSYSLCTSGPFMHADKPRPVAALGTEQFERFMSEKPRSTARWHLAVDYIKRNTKNGKFPSYLDVQSATGLSPPTVAKAMAFLRAQQHQATGSK